MMAQQPEKAYPHAPILISRRALRTVENTDAIELNEQTSGPSQRSHTDRDPKATKAVLELTLRRV